MPGGARVQVKPRAAVLVASGERYDAVARQVGVHERTIRRWVADDEFLSRVRVVQAEVVRLAAARLADGMLRASEVLVDLLDDPDARIRLMAAREVLASGARVREQEVVAHRLVALESQATALVQANGIAT
jgi:transposase-like protein